MQLHPDKGGDPDGFAALQEAYAVLSNTTKRKHYDETGRSTMTAEEILRATMERNALAEPDPQKSTSTSPSAHGLSPTKDRLKADLITRVGAVESNDNKIWPGAPNGQYQQGPRNETAKASAPPASRPPQKFDLLAKVQSVRNANNNSRLGAGKVPDVVSVPLAFEVEVPHVIVVDRSGVLDLQLQPMQPTIQDSRLLEGTVLLQMRALPLSPADLCGESRFKDGDFYGDKGIGQVKMVGPNVQDLAIGDWVVPLLEVDEDGDLDENASPPGTGRSIAVFSAKRCARVACSGDVLLSVGQMAVAKSIGTAFKMMEEYGAELGEGNSVIVNAANGVIGQVLIQMLTVLKLQVFAVIREHEGTELLRRRLEELGAVKALIDDDFIKVRIEEMKIPLPSLAFDGVGGDSTARIACTLSKTGNIVCYGQAGGQKKRVLPSGWGKKWKGTVHQFSFDEWLQEDLKVHSGRFSEWLRYASQLMSSKTLQLDIWEFSTTEFQKALDCSRSRGRAHTIVLHLPGLDQVRTGQSMQHTTASTPTTATTLAGVGTVEPVALNKRADAVFDQMPAAQAARARQVWDMAFFDWEEEQREKRDKLEQDEQNLFQPDPVMQEWRIQSYVDDSLALPVALELGAAKGEATAVLLWLGGPGDVPEEHGPWLDRLATVHNGLRILVLKPRAGFRWYDMSDMEAVKLGLRYTVSSDNENDLDLDPEKSRGEISFLPLLREEIEALQQVESAAIGLARRTVIEEKSLAESCARLDRLPFFLGGYGQGGTIALFTAICLMQKPVLGVAFCHSGLPCASMLGKRLQVGTRKSTKLYAIYDRADKEVPYKFPEAIRRVFGMLGTHIQLEWLCAGDGHEFFDAAAEKVTNCVQECLEGAADPASKAKSKAARALGVPLAQPGRRIDCSLPP